MGDREEFLQIFQQHVTRPGSEKLLDWLDDTTDFLHRRRPPPGSTGPVRAVCVCTASASITPSMDTLLRPRATARRALPSARLLHDLCKANFYKRGTRNVKNDETGQWEKVPSYSCGGSVPLRPRREERLSSSSGSCS